MPRVHIDNLTRYQVSPDTGCWDWTGPVIHDGYGKASRTIHGTRLAHRIIYIEHIGPVPEGLELDHTCRNRRCVNPHHLEPVTSAENTRRGWQARLAGRCLNGGHDLTTPGATYTEADGRHRCRQCRRLAWRRRSERRRGTLQPAA